MRKPKSSRPLQTIAALCAVSLAFYVTGAAQAPAPHYEGQVTRVVDGDTFYLDSVETRIRIWGLDAPERGERGGNAATRALREIAHGRRLDCKQVDIDRYGRIVGQCFLPDGRDVAALMIESGTAQEYLRYSGGYYSTLKFASSN